MDFIILKRRIKGRKPVPEDPDNCVIEELFDLLHTG